MVLICGGRAVLVARDEVPDMALLSQRLEGCTLLHGVPSLMSEIVGWRRQSPRSLSEIRMLFVGGDKVSPSLLSDMCEVFPQARVYELYGPTESTILSTSLEVDDAALAWCNPVIGQALSGRQLYVLDGLTQPVPGVRSL